MDFQTFRQFIRDTHVPGILLVASDRSKRYFEKKNGLGVAQTLSALGTVEGKPYFRTPTQAYGLDSFRIEFVDPEALEPTSLNDAEKALHDTLREKLPSKSVSEYIEGGPKDAADVNRFWTGTAAEQRDWCTAFRCCVERTLKHHETRMLGQPVGCLLVASTADGPPGAVFQQLSFPKTMPSPFTSQHYDQAMPRFFLIVHDKSDPECLAVDIQKLQHDCQKDLPHDRTFVLEIENNFGEAQGASHTNQTLEAMATYQKCMNRLASAPFSTQASLPKSTTFRGGSFTPSDFVGLEKFVNTFVTSGILPSIESRIFYLESRVAEKRKGWRNVMSRWWRPSSAVSEGKRDGPNGDTSTTEFSDKKGTRLSTGQISPSAKTQYRFDSIESHVRLLADLAFMMQDYDMALNTYRLSRDDFKSMVSAKALLHHGSAVERMALSSFMKDSSSSKCLGYLAQARASFSEAYTSIKLGYKSGSSDPKNELALAARHLSNASMFYADIVLISDSCSLINYREAARFMAESASRETELVSAVLLHRAAFLFLHRETGSALTENGVVKGAAMRSRADLRAEWTPWLRKFGFYLVMACKNYMGSENFEHALCCLATVRNFYNGPWEYISDHIDMKIAKCCSNLGLLRSALFSGTQILKRCRQSAEYQNELFQNVLEWMEAMKGTKETEIDFNMGVVAVVQSQVVVIPQDNASIIPEINMDCSPTLSIEHGQSNASESGYSLELEGRGVFKERGIVFGDFKEESLWLSLAKLLDANAKIPGVWIESRKNLRGDRTREPRGLNQTDTCHVGEPIHVHVPFYNPSSVQIHINGLQLLSELSLCDENNGSSAIVEVSKNLELSVLESCCIEPKQKTIVQLCVTPLRPGTLNIRGLKWKFFGFGNIFYAFDKPKDERWQNCVTDSKSEKPVLFKKRVLPSSAWLGAEIASPKTACQGELVNTELELINLGSASCKGPIFVACDMACLCVGSETMETSPCGIAASAEMLNDAGTVFKLPVSDLEPSLPVSVPLCIRIPTSVIGDFKLRILIGYSDGSNIRFLRTKFTTRIIESMVVTTKFASIGERLLDGLSVSRGTKPPFLLTLSVQNASCPNVSCRLNSVLCISKEWGIVDYSRTSSEVLKGDTKTFLFLVYNKHRDDHLLSKIEPEEIESAISKVLTRVDIFKPKEREEDAEYFMNESCMLPFHFLCLEHTQRVLEARQKARAKYEAIKSEMRKEGTLPVSVQGIRRLAKARELGEEIDESEDPRFPFLESLKKAFSPTANDPPYPSIASVFNELFPSQIQIVLEWEVINMDSKTVQESSLQPPRKGLFHFHDVGMPRSNPLSLHIDAFCAQVGSVAPVVLHIYNSSPMEVENVVLSARNDKAFSWVGFTRKKIPTLKPGQGYRIVLEAIFQKSGCFNLNTFSVCLGKDPTEHEFDSVFFVTVYNHNGDKQNANTTLMS